MATYYKNISEHKLLRVISEFKDDCLKLTVLDNNTAWETMVCLPVPLYYWTFRVETFFQVDKAELTTFAKNQEFESYYNNLQKYFRPPLKRNEELNFANGEFTVRTTLTNQMKEVLFHTTMQQVCHYFCLKNKKKWWMISAWLQWHCLHQIRWIQPKRQWIEKGERRVCCTTAGWVYTKFTI